LRIEIVDGFVKLKLMCAVASPYSVIVGAARMGGSDGLLNLLQGRGYKIEQL